MMSQALEQMLAFAPSIGQTRMYGTIDRYTQGTIPLYSFDPPEPMGQQSFNPPGLIDSQRTLNDYGLNNFFKPTPQIEPRITIEPFRNGMDLDGGYKLYGNRNNAIINDPSTGLDIHHHNNGGGALNFGSDRITELNWNQPSFHQAKLTDYFNR